MRFFLNVGVDGCSDGCKGCCPGTAFPALLFPAFIHQFLLAAALIGTAFADAAVPVLGLVHDPAVAFVDV